MGGFFFCTAQMRTQFVLFALLVCCGLATCAADAQDYVYNIPRTIPANGMDMFNPEAPDFITAIDSDMSMTHFLIEIVDTYGNTLDRSQVYLHHLVITSPTVRNLACPEIGGDGHIWAAGAELTPLTGFPAPFGFKIRPTETDWQTRVHAVNPTNQTIDYVIRYTIGLAPWTDDLVQVEGWYASVTGCDGFEYNEIDIPYTPEDPNYVLNLDFPCTFDGIMIGGGGHTHFGGIDIFLSRPGQIVYSIRPEYQDSEHPEWVTSVDVYLNPWRMKMNEPMRITAIFNASNPDSDDNMGIMSGYALVDRLYDGTSPLKRSTDNKNYLLGSGIGDTHCTCEYSFSWTTISVIALAVGSLSVSLAMAFCFCFVMYYSRRSHSSDTYEVEMSEPDL